MAKKGLLSRFRSDSSDNLSEEENLKRISKSSKNRFGGRRPHEKFFVWGGGVRVSDPRISEFWALSGILTSLAPYAPPPNQTYQDYLLLLYPPLNYTPLVYYNLETRGYS